MNINIINSVESAIMLAGFYLLYSLVLEKETFFKLNRVYLISSLLFSITIPFLNFDLLSLLNSDVNFIDNVQNLKKGYNELNEVVVYAYSGKYTIAAVLEYLKAIYLLGMIISSAFFLFGLSKICSIIIHNTSYKIEKYRIIETTNNIVPFSLFKWIIINPEKYTSEDIKQIIAHEKMHAFQLHSIDLILIEVLVILFWFNPFIYWYRKSIREIHEYLADQAVVENGFDQIDYQKLLLSQATGSRFIGLTSRFSYSLSKNRLKMLTMMKSKNMSKTKVLLAIPFAIAFIFFFTNSTEFAKASRKNNVKTEIAAVDDSAIVETDAELDGEVCFTAEVMPKFQGQESDAFRPFVQKNLRYPEEAIKQRMQGTVYVQFDVDAEGNIRNAKVVRGKYPLLNAEALRVTNLSPKWTPAEQDGKKVNVRFTFPVTFALNDSK